MDDRTNLEQAGPKQAGYSFLIGAIILGVILVWVMLGMAFGLSAVLFGVIASVIAFALIIHRYRFGLRTFLLATMVLGVWLGLKVSQDVRMDQALTTIENQGGQLKVYDRKPNFPWGLWKYRYHLDFFGLKEPLSAQVFSRLQVFAPSSLQSLSLSNTGVTDQDLEFVEGLTELEILLLSNETYANGEVIPDRPQNKITDAGLARLGNLRSLKGIDLSGTEVTDDGLKNLSQMPNLIWVYLDGTKVTGSGIAHLKSHNDLHMLELNGCKLTPTAYENVIQLPILSSLGLRNTRTTDADLHLLQENTKLGILRLNDTNVSSDAVHQFQLTHPDCKIER